MSDYIVRVQLIGNPDVETYASLHTLMSNRGFSMQTTDKNGSSLTLPHATYIGVSRAAAGALSISLRDSIQTRVWMKAKVLAIKYAEANLANPT